MAITVLPTKTIGSLGPVKSDTRAYLRPTQELPAVELEAIKQQVIDNATEIGLTDGSTAGSLREATQTAGPSLEVGSLLWEWNGTDLAQFDATPLDYERDLGSPGGGNAETALVVTVVADPDAYFGGNVLRFTATSLAGGGVLAVAASEITLPSRYVVYVRLRGEVSGTSMVGYGCMVAFNDDGTDAMEGILVNRPEGGNTNEIVAITANRFGNAEGLVGSGTFNAACAARGGVVQLLTVEKKPGGEATGLAVVSCSDKAMAGTGPIFDTALPHTIAGVGTAWDSLTMGRVGLAIHEGVNGTSGVVDFKDFRIYAHPDD
jgi:hypothetical protein